MKLVKNHSQKADSGQCHEVTNQGHRCTRAAWRAGYCKQHYRLLEERGLLLIATGDELLEEIPELPEGLGKVGRLHWQIYCQYLIDQGRLYQVYLAGIASLCYLEEQLQQAKQDLADYGAVNVYENGIQRNGYASHFDKLLVHIRSLRSDYGLTVASDKTLQAPGGGEAGEPKAGYEQSKSKNW